MLAVVVALQGCVDANKGARWPSHRKDHDARLDQLAERVAADDKQLAVLTERIEELEALIARRAQPSPPAPESPTTPAP
jgi:hypothetical protein